MSELKGMFFDARKTFTPEEAMHEECLRHLSQEVAGRVLEPARQELASRIQEAVKNFLERKRVMPATAKDRYRNLEPLDFHLGVRGDHIDDFLNKMEINVKFFL